MVSLTKTQKYKYTLVRYARRVSETSSLCHYDSAVSKVLLPSRTSRYRAAGDKKEGACLFASLDAAQSDRQEK